MAMMLSFSNILKDLNYFKLLFFNKCLFTNPNFSIFKFSSLVHSSGFVQSNSYTSGNEHFPLQEIGNININQLNGDLVKWYEIVDEILKLKASGRKLPEYLKRSNIEELLECGSRTQRLKYLTFLFKKEKMKLNEAEKKRRKRAELTALNTKNVLNSGHIQYGCRKNTLILKIWGRYIQNFYNKRLANSVLFGQKIVIDLGYDQFMQKKERSDCANQVALVLNANKVNREPYNIYLCNSSSQSKCVQYLCKELPNIDESLTTLTEQSYLDLFPKEDLVYLSPHAPEPLKTYDHKAVYIIGGFVDIVNKTNVSLFKSQDEGIRSYSLPLDEYVLWGDGSKSLTINQVFSIMQTMKDTGDWRQAFKHIPTRKLKRVMAESEETELMSDKLFVIRN